MSLLGYVCVGILALTGCSEPQSRSDQAADSAQPGDAATENAGGSQPGSANPPVASGRLEEDSAAQNQFQQISQQMARTRDVTKQQLEALESLYSRFPNAASVRSLLHQAYVLRFDNDSAIGLLQSVPREQRTETEIKLLAQRFITVGRHEDAADILEPLLEANPQDLQVLNQLGQAYNGLGDFEKTAHMLDAVWESAGAQNDPGTLYLRGQAYFNMDHPEEAIDALEHCLSIRPEHASAHYTLARAYSKAGDKTQAASHQATFQKLSAAAGEAKTEQMKLAALARSTNLAFDEGRYEDCERFLLQGLELAQPPLKVQLHQYLARVYEAMGRLDDARAQHTEAQRIHGQLSR